MALFLLATYTKQRRQVQGIVKQDRTRTWKVGIFFCGLFILQNARKYIWHLGRTCLLTMFAEERVHVIYGPY